MRTGYLVVILALAGATAGPQTPLPSIDPIRAVQNAASFGLGQPIAPGSLIAIFGINLGSGFTLFNSEPLPTSLAGTSVTINGVPAPLVGVSPTQINAQLPWNLPSGGSVPIVVRTAAGDSLPNTVFLTPAAPGLFNYTDLSGVNRPAAYNNADGTLPVPMSVQVPGYKSRPSRPGEAVVIWCTGLGAVTNTPANGAPGLAQSPYSATLTTPVVLVDGVPANVLYSVLSTQYAGIYQVGIIVPTVGPGDAVPLQIQMNGVTTTDRVQMAIGM
jgi:uncharacterized protein (TIGR03437 family)